MAVDPHVVLQYACTIASALLLLYIVIRGVRNGKRRVWLRYSTPAAIWFALASAYSLARIFYPPFTPLPFGFELVDLGWLVWLIAIGTLTAYIIDGYHEQ